MGRKYKLRPGFRANNNEIAIMNMRKFSRNETAASLPEYALLLGLIAVVCLAGMSFLGNSISNVLMSISSSI
jgi:Flp pilus assembly pilin Flp